MIFSGFSQKSWLWLRSDLFLRVFSASSWSMESPSIKIVPFNHWIGVIGGVLILLLRNSLCYLSSREAVFLRLKVTHLFPGVFFIDRIIYFLNQLYVLIDFLSNVVLLIDESNILLQASIISSANFELKVEGSASRSKLLPLLSLLLPNIFEVCNFMFIFVSIFLFWKFELSF